MFLSISTLVVIGLLIVVIVAVVRRPAGEDRLEAKFAEIADSVQGRLGTTRLGFPRIEGSRHSIPYRIYVLTGSQYRSPDLRIEFQRKPPFSITLQEEGLNSKLERLVGFGSGREVKTGVPEFDRQFALRTSNPVKCLEYFKTPGVMETLWRIYDRGCFFMFRGSYAEIIKPLSAPKMSLKIRHASDFIVVGEVLELLEQGVFLVKTLEEIGEGENQVE